MKAGKIRAIGLSNETTWGTQKFLTLAEQKDCRASRRSRTNTACSIGILIWTLPSFRITKMLACSPTPRWRAVFSQANICLVKNRQARAVSINGDIGGRLVPQQQAATQAYVELARQHGIDPSQLALAFCLSRPFMAAPIIGATSMEQLKINIGAADVTLSDEILKEIAKIHRQYRCQSDCISSASRPGGIVRPAHRKPKQIDAAIHTRKPYRKIQF